MISENSLSGGGGRITFRTALWLFPLVLAGTPTFGQGQYMGDPGVQVLTRGPVHEAFAEASYLGAQASSAIQRRPPDAISELPPGQRPEGANVAWIPGYWSWDEERNDFIWVSGVWRDLPPGRQWVPGYWWDSGERSSQWISGFWGEAERTEITYLPQPPAPLEAGPNSPAPGPGSVWTQGSWVWIQARYYWQPGYWVVQQPDWIWTGGNYTWTPRGYVYVPGYWDHDILHRGVMFAPVYYEQPVYTRPSYFYSPTTVIDLAVVLTNLFVHPSSQQYYYGDYYDRRYEDRGFHSWYSHHSTGYGNDPIFDQYRSWQLHQDPDWDRHIDERYQYRRDHVDARPPQTLALQININNIQKSGVPGDNQIGRSFADLVGSKSSPQRFTPVNMDERKEIETRGREVRQFGLERAKIETAPAEGGKTKGPHENARPLKMRMPASPVAAKRVEHLEGARTPPPAPPGQRLPRSDGRSQPVKYENRNASPTPASAPERPDITRPGGQGAPERTGMRPSPSNEKTNRPKPVPTTLKPQSSPAKALETSKTGKGESPKTEAKTQAPHPDTKKPPGKPDGGSKGNASRGKKGEKK